MPSVHSPHLPSTLLIQEMKSLRHVVEYVFHKNDSGKITDMCPYALDFISPDDERIARIDYRTVPATITRWR